MKTRHLHRTTFVARPIEAVFEFFSEAANLEAITPPWLGFEILNPASVPMGAGAILDYRIRLRGISLRWQSEITAWESPYRFVDEQRRGPYRSWRHEHRFVEREGGTEVIDDVTYSVYGGALIERLFVNRDLEKIFDHRQRKIRELLDPIPTEDLRESAIPPPVYLVRPAVETRA